MIVLAITVLLTATGIVIMPCWRYSARWGYGPGACIGLFLIGIGIFAVVGRVGGPDALAERLAKLAKPSVMIDAVLIDPARPRAIALTE